MSFFSTILKPTAIILSVLLTTYIVQKTADIRAEHQYLATESPLLLEEINTILSQQSNFEAYKHWEYLSYGYVMKMQDERFPVYKALHRYQRDYKRLLKKLAKYYNNHIALWHHQKQSLPKYILEEQFRAAPKTIDDALNRIQYKLENARQYFLSLTIS